MDFFSSFFSGQLSTSSPNRMASKRCSKCQFGHNEVSACSKCKTAWYCSKECQKAHWEIHKPLCRPYSPNEVWGIKLLCDAEKPPSASKDNSGPVPGRFVHELVNTNHPVFKRGELCPVTALFGIPLLIYSAAVERGIDMPGQGNQPAVYLRIEPDNGFAPPPWQMCLPGSCIVVRRDKKPLLKATLEAIYAFHGKILNGAGYPESDGWAPIREYMTPAAFQFFSRDHFEKQKEKKRVGFDPFYEPL